MTRLTIIILALLLDLAVGDPPNRYHPLLLMGRWLSLGRRRAPRRQRFWFGAGWTLAGIALFAWPFWKVEGRPTRRKAEMGHEKTPFLHPSSFIPHPSSLIPHPSSLILHPFLLKPVFAYRALRRAVREVEQALTTDNLPEARRLLSWHLVSRETGELSAAEVAGAAIESLAENLTDSLLAPLLAYAAGGLPAAWAYRFVNTADAMWGYRTPEFEQLGKFPARLDDALNWLPARLAGWLLVLAARLVGEDAAAAARTMLAQNGRTASLNAGWTMSAMAGALGVTLNKRGVYKLEGGPAKPDATAIERALRVADTAAVLGIAGVGGIHWLCQALRMNSDQ
ncbi:MAG: adenosylcobinamide-phosphate synthase CbiB [Chloroflexota bacterium]